MPVFKISLGADIRRLRPEQPILQFGQFEDLIRKLFALPDGFGLVITYTGTPTPLLINADNYSQLILHVAPDALLAFRVELNPILPTPVAPPQPSYAPLSFPPLPSPSKPPSSSPAPSLPVPSPSRTRSVPSSKPAPQPDIPGYLPTGFLPPQSSKPGKPVPPAGIEVPLKYRQIIWSIQDEYREATEFRVLTLLIKFAANLSQIRYELNTLTRTQVLRNDNGRRGRPKKTPAPPLYFPRGFQQKVRTLVEAGFPQDKVIDTLILHGGSAEQASLALIEADPKQSPESIYHHHRRAVEASVAHPHDGRFGEEPLDRDITLDQRVVDSLLLLERTLGFDRSQIVKAVDSLSGRSTAPPPPTDSAARSRVLQSIPSNTASALTVLSGMGFNDSMLNLYLLERHKGNLAAVIEELTGTR